MRFFSANRTRSGGGLSGYLRRFTLYSVCFALLFFTGQIIWQIATRRTHTFTYRVQPGPQTPEEVAEVLSRRCKNLKQFDRIRETEVRLEGDNVHVSLTSNYKVDQYLKWLTRTGIVELRLVHPDTELLQQNPNAAVPEGYEVREVTETKYLLGRPGEMEDVQVPFAVSQRPELTVTQFRSVHFQTVELARRVVITLQFTEEDAAVFRRITSSNVGRRLAFFIDEEFCAAPKIVQPVKGDRVQLQGWFYLPVARRWASILAGGAILNDLELLERSVH